MTQTLCFPRLSVCILPHATEALELPSSGGINFVSRDLLGLFHGEIGFLQGLCVHITTGHVPGAPPRGEGAAARQPAPLPNLNLKGTQILWTL